MWLLLFIVILGYLIAMHKEILMYFKLLWERIIDYLFNKLDENNIKAFNEESLFYKKQLKKKNNIKEWEKLNKR